MKNQTLLALLTAASLAAASFPACAAPSSQPASFRGVAVAPTTQANKVIVVSDATRYVNVDSNTTVRFVVGDRSFTWFFDNGNVFIDVFDLAQIAPSGLLNHAVKVYVTNNYLDH